MSATRSRTTRRSEAQVADSRGAEVSGIVWKNVEDTPAQNFVSLRHGRPQIGIAHGYDLEIRREDEVQAGRQLEKSSKVQQRNRLQQAPLCANSATTFISAPPVASSKQGRSSRPLAWQHVPAQLRFIAIGNLGPLSSGSGADATVCIGRTNCQGIAPCWASLRASTQARHLHFINGTHLRDRGVEICWLHPK